MKGTMMNKTASLAATAAFAAVAILSGCGTSGPQAASPSPSPTISMPSTDPTVQAQITAAEQAYRARSAAAMKMVTDGPTEANIAAVKAYSANDEQRQYVDAEAQSIKDKNVKAKNPGKIVSIQLDHTSLDAKPPTVTLTVCNSREGMNITSNGTPAAVPPYFIEQPVMVYQNGKWLVQSLTGKDVESCA